MKPCTHRNPLVIERDPTLAQELFDIAIRKSVAQVHRTSSTMISGGIGSL
jgi:hypothetical protein